MSSRIKPSAESRFKNIENRLKRIEDVLEFSPSIASFDDWIDFTDRDKKILFILLNKERQGASTTAIATELGMEVPEGTGRVLVYKRLKRIERVSRKIKGMPIVLYEKKKWSLNFDDFQFNIKEDNKK